MKIRRFILKIACRDDSNVTERDVENAILQGAIHQPVQGIGVSSAQFIDETLVPVPDWDQSLEGTAFDKAVDAWDKAAEFEIFGEGK